MELLWEFDKPNRLGDIENELKNIVTNMFKDEMKPYRESTISKYSIVYETTTFIFETYKDEFEADIKSRFHYPVSEEYLEFR